MHMIMLNDVMLANIMKKMISYGTLFPHILALNSFKKWRIDYIEEVHSNPSRGIKYIIIVTKYLTK